MTKANVIRKLQAGHKIKVTQPTTHKYYNQERQADKVQTNAVRFIGGSWLYFDDIDKTTITEKGFSLTQIMSDEKPVTYEWV
jgi:4-hydroxyphenylpyruvate dioxygenase-like putative hemolysin